MSGNFAENGGKSKFDYSETRDWLQRNEVFCQWIQDGAVLIGGNPSGGGGNPPPSNLLQWINIGDSVVNNQGGADLLGGRLNSYSGNQFDTSRFALDGATYASVEAIVNTNVSVDNNQKVVLVFAGLNDIHNDQVVAPIPANPTKAQTLCDRYKSLISVAKNKGVNVIVIGFTIPVARANDATREQLRLDTNALIRAQNNADILVDIGAHFVYGNRALVDLPLFFYSADGNSTDGIHLSNHAITADKHINGYDIYAVNILKAVGQRLNNPIKSVWLPLKNRIKKGQDLPIEMADYGGDTNNVHRFFRVGQDNQEILIKQGLTNQLDAVTLPAGVWIIREKATNGQTTSIKDWVVSVLSAYSIGNGQVTPSEVSALLNSTVALVASGFTNPIKWIKAKGDGFLTAVGNNASYECLQEGGNNDFNVLILAQEEYYDFGVTSNADNTLNGTMVTQNYYSKVEVWAQGQFHVTPRFPDGFHTGNRLGVFVAGQRHQIGGDGHYYGFDGAGAVVVDVDLSASFASGNRYKFLAGANRKLFIYKQGQNETIWTLVYESSVDTLPADLNTNPIKSISSFNNANQTIGRWEVGGESVIGQMPRGWNASGAEIFVYEE